MNVNDIENKIAHNELTAAQVFTQMKQHVVKIRRRSDEGELAECPLCSSLDIGGAHDTVSCYGCGLKITKPIPLQNAMDAWNMRSGKSLI